MMHIGIVGHGADKFNKETELWAKSIIRNIMINNPQSIYVSGHSPLGGVDIWVEDIGNEIGVKLDIKPPKKDNWEGYKERNIEIADNSDVVIVILVNEYPLGYTGRRWVKCYHCDIEHKNHVKSGGCWTGYKARELGKEAYWYIYPSNMVEE